MSEREATRRAAANISERDAAPTRPLVVQAKLTVGSTDDPAEREADRVADDVMRSLSTTSASVSEPEVASTRIARAAATPVGMAGGDVDPVTTSKIRRAAGKGAAIDDRTRARMEPAFGASLGGVRIHRNSALAPELSARAFTAGSDIHFAPGEYRPGTSAGEHLLAHELAHVMQQGGEIHRKYGKPQAPKFQKFVEEQRHEQAKLDAAAKSQPVPPLEKFKNQKELNEHLARLAADPFRALANKWITASGEKSVTVEEIAKYHGYVLPSANTVAKFKRANLSTIIHEDDEWVIGLEKHQNKHQTTKIPTLGDYDGGSGDKFNSTVDLAWHKDHAVRDLTAWASKLVLTDKKPSIISSLKDVKDTSGYDPPAMYYATAGLLEGETKKFIEYHCYPRPVRMG